jgi:hypothetical protein
MSITREDVKKAIERFEYYRNGLDRLSTAHVEVMNLKMRKTKPITADIVLCFGEGDCTKTYRKCEYILTTTP